MGKYTGGKSSANQKTDLKKPKFNMEGFKPSEEDAGNIERKRLALSQAAKKASQIERDQRGKEIPEYSKEWSEARRARLERQLAQQEYEKVLMNLDQQSSLNNDLIDDVYGGTQDTTGQIGTPIVEEATAPEQTIYSTPEEAPDTGTGFPGNEPESLGVGPGGIAVTDPIGTMSKAPLIEAILSIPQEQRTTWMWNQLDEHGPEHYDRMQAVDREMVDQDEDTGDRPSPISKVQIPYQEKMQMMHDSHEMGRQIQREMDRLWESGQLYANQPGQPGWDRADNAAMLQRIKDGEFTVESVRDFMEGIVTTHEELARRGVPNALSDVMLHSVLHQIREAYRRKGDPDDIRGREEAIRDSGAAPTTQEENDQRIVMRAHDHREIGNLILGAMGIAPDSRNVNNTTAGTIANNMVAKVFPDLFYKDSKGNTVVSQEGFNTAERMLPMTQTILPQVKIGVRFKKKTTQSNIQRPRSGDKDVYYGDYDLVNDTIDVLDNQAWTIDQDFVRVVDALVQSVETDVNGNVVLTNIDKLIGIGPEDTGQLNNRTGERRKKDPRTGRDVLDENGQPVMEWYAGDRIKDVIFNDNMDWATALGNNRFYYDHFLGGNNRFYISQFVGNYHSHKLARAMLMADFIEMYDTSNPVTLMELKAGIAKKFGKNKMGVQAAADYFDANIQRWSNMMDNIREDGKAIIDLAYDNDGWASVSALTEAKKLFDHLRDVEAGKSNTVYTSKFLTEIDGTGNGLAHNALQAGDFNTALLTNINPYFNAPKGTARVDKDGNLLEHDVYHVTGSGLKAQLESLADEADADYLNQAFVALGLINDKTRRDFSKAPLMIFQYGAGRNLIKRIVRENVLLMLEDEGTLNAFNQVAIAMGKDPKTKAQIQEAIEAGDFEGSSNYRDADWIIDRMGDMMVKSVESNFPMLKDLSNILSSMANAASLHQPPIDLSVITIGGHRINFGHTMWEKDEVRSFVDTVNKGDYKQSTKFDVAEKNLYPQGRTIFTKTKEGRDIQMKRKATGTEPNPFYRNDWKKHPIFNPPEIPIGTLKAATQAAVLMTHSLDGINVALSLTQFKKDHTQAGVAQIFDGFLVTPKMARQLATQLNKDFLDINFGKGGRSRTSGHGILGPEDTVADARKDAKNLNLYNPDTRYDFLMNNPNNSNVLLLYRAMARLGFRWDDYKGGGLVERIKKFEQQRKAYRKKFLKKDGTLNYDSTKQYFWD